MINIISIPSLSIQYHPSDSYTNQTRINGRNINLDRTGVNPNTSYVELTGESSPGLLTCPVWYSTQELFYKHVRITCLDDGKKPIQGIPWYCFTIMFFPVYNETLYYTPDWDPMPMDNYIRKESQQFATDENGEIEFRLKSDTSIVGDIICTVGVLYQNEFVEIVDYFDNFLLECRSFDYDKVNGCDGCVNKFDFLHFISIYHCDDWHGDYNWDKRVNLLDFVRFARYYLEGWGCDY